MYYWVYRNSSIPNVLLGLQKQLHTYGITGSTETEVYVMYYRVYRNSSIPNVLLGLQKQQYT